MKILLSFLVFMGIYLNANAITIHVDFTVTSSEGCTFRVVGDVEIDIAVPLKNSTITGFHGTITLGGPSAAPCPHGTYNVNFGFATGEPTGGYSPEELETINQLLWEDPDMQEEIDNLLN